MSFVPEKKIMRERLNLVRKEIANAKSQLVSSQAEYDRLMEARQKSSLHYNSQIETRGRILHMPPSLDNAAQYAQQLNDIHSGNLRVPATPDELRKMEEAIQENLKKARLGYYYCNNCQYYSLADFVPCPKCGSI
jgi:hypothetical protein